jgi:DNA-binding Lrp family transcriptional regulator
MILDNVDLKILDELQRDGALSNVTLAKRIGLSPSPCLARVKALESNGVIQRYVALASAAALGLGLTVFISISLKTQSKETLADFEAHIARHDEVMECYFLLDDRRQRLFVARGRARHGGAGAIHSGTALADSGGRENPLQFCAQTSALQNGLAFGIGVTELAAHTRIENPPSTAKH